jgi:tRNA-splicing ligase RtcB
MCAVKTNIRTEEFDPQTLKNIVLDIKERIPVGFKHHKKRQNLPSHLKNPSGLITKMEFNDIPYQIGTLGGGNHFIEIQKDKDNFIWIMLHSGSRNLGKKVADYYNKEAKKWSKNWENQVLKSWNLAFLDVNSDLGNQYIEEMNYCLQFAKANRLHMLDTVKNIFYDHTQCDFGEMISIHHNYANYEKHFGEWYWIHRKGAISAKKGEFGIVPGSQGTPSYIVRGKGNVDSFMSSAHGAGRVISRREAIRKLNLNSIRSELDKRGIIHSIGKQKDLDEAPQCYKNIDQVIEEQNDLVEPICKLYPLAVIKG